MVDKVCSTEMGSSSSCNYASLGQKLIYNCSQNKVFYSNHQSFVFWLELLISNMTKRNQPAAKTSIGTLRLRVLGDLFDVSGPLFAFIPLGLSSEALGIAGQAFGNPGLQLPSAIGYSRNTSKGDTSVQVLCNPRIFHKPLGSYSWTQIGLQVNTRLSNLWPY